MSAKSDSLEKEDKEEGLGAPPSNQYSGSASQSGDGKKNSIVVKVGMVGDSQIGKTSLMVKYVEGTFDEDYIQTLGTFFVIFGNFSSAFLNILFLDLA